MSEIILRPCPFCGGEGYFTTPKHEKNTAFDSISVECRNCGAHPYALLVYDGKSYQEKCAAIAEIWNRRSDSCGVHGHWEIDKDGRCGCSVCGGEGLVNVVSLKLVQAPYCFHCGAKMIPNDNSESACNGYNKMKLELASAKDDLSISGDCRVCGNKTPWCDTNPDACTGWKWRGIRLIKGELECQK